MRKAFKDWLEKRKQTFEKNLKAEQIAREKQKHPIVKVERPAESKTQSETHKYRVRYICKPQPEELAFLFMKIMDEIASKNKKVKNTANRKETLKDVSAAHSKDAMMSPNSNVDI